MNSLISWPSTAVGRVKAPATAPTTNIPITSADRAIFCRTIFWLRLAGDDRVEGLLALADPLLADVAKGVYECTRYASSGPGPESDE